MELSWSTPITFTEVHLYSSQGYELRDFDIQYHVGFPTSRWVTLRGVDGNTNTLNAYIFNPTQTQRLRVRARSGPLHQPEYARINEIEVY